MIGAVAGVVATAAMTASMDAMYRRLAEDDRYPLPPRELTERIDGLIHGQAGDELLTVEALAAHFGYGAATGALYGMLGASQVGRPALTGAGYGVLIWLASYLGWIPLAGVLRPATRHPAPRNALMLSAHLVWGAALGLTANRLAKSLGPFRGGRLRDAPRGAFLGANTSAPESGAP